MIERFIKDREAAWVAKNKTFQAEGVEQQGQKGKIKGKHAVLTAQEVSFLNI
jgi:hypothetical protein